MQRRREWRYHAPTGFASPWFSAVWLPSVVLRLASTWQSPKPSLLKWSEESPCSFRLTYAQLPRRRRMQEATAYLKVGPTPSRPQARSAVPAMMMCHGDSYLTMALSHWSGYPHRPCEDPPPTDGMDPVSVMQRYSYRTYVQGAR
ncbi:hypothetical protein GQ53DRAFT_32815 [Thozetella sp. PMI_491]|nr:hypothetical protein GQ53DRAFT_32815 [Thozetella sp. PMI_491]